jgi:predicted transcriptional regulator
MAEDTAPDITALTVQLLSAFVSNNTVSSDGLADLIRTTRVALTGDPTATTVQQEAQPDHVPAVSIRKSLSSDDHIISLIDGRSYKTLKRHLASHGLTPDQYRERYKLPKTYPLVARNYSQARRAVAERLGLGRRPAKSMQAPNAAADTATVAPTPTKAKGASGASDTTPGKARAAKAAPASAAASAKSKAPASKDQKSAGQPRRRLSIASPKAASAPASGNLSGEPAAKVEPAARSTSQKPAAARKAKAAPKPKTQKSDARGAVSTAKGGKLTPQATKAE